MCEKQELWAFWAEENNTWVIFGGKIEEFLDNGRVVVEGTRGLTWLPVRILPGKAGSDMLEHIKSMRDRMFKEQEKVREKYALGVRKALNI